MQRAKYMGGGLSPPPPSPHEILTSWSQPPEPPSTTPLRQPNIEYVLYICQSIFEIEGPLHNLHCSLAKF